MEQQNKNTLSAETAETFRAAAYRRASTPGPLPAGAQTRFKDVSSFNKKLQGNPTGSSKAAEEIATEGSVIITKTSDLKTEILCLKFTQECELLAAGLTTGEVKLFMPNTGKCVLTLLDQTEERHGPVTGIKHRPVHKSMPNTNTITCTYTNGSVKSWHCQTGACLYTINENRQSLGIAYHHRLPKFVTVGDDAKIYLYDEESKTQERVFSKSESKKQDGHTSRVFTACFNPKLPHEFISGGWDDCVHFWDLRQQNATRHFHGAHVCGDGLDIDKTGTQILTSSWQKKDPLQLWDYGTGKLITSIEPDHFTCALYCGKWITKEVFATGGSEPNVMRIIDQRTMATIGSVAGLPGGVYSLDEGPARQTKQGKHKGPAMKGGVADYLPKLAFCADRKMYEIDYA